MWYKNAFRRIVIDMHIPDWDARFLSEFDPQNYVDMLKRARAQSIVLYAQSHVGIFNYPTKIGVMHQGLKGRDIFGELVDLCHQNNIAAVAYTSLIFDRWASLNHPDWRIKAMDGTDAAATWRFGVCCPNSPYRDYAAAWAGELLTRYPVDGVRFDMTFWPAICYCPHCQARFKREVGVALPEVINWEDPTWVAFQRKREEWLADFAAHLTAAARRARPEASVEHQASTYSLDWKFGVSEKLMAHNDFLQGDFYGDALQGSFVRKFLYNFSPNLPYGFETSANVTLGNHTNIKSRDLMLAKASAAVAGQGAMIFIDAIDPVGTLNPRVYDRIGSVLDETLRYDPFRGGELAQDVAVYFSLSSKYNPADNGKTPLDPTLAGRFPHIDSLLSTCAALITNHIPFGVVTKKDLKRLARHRILVLPNLLEMNEEEVQAVRQYVAEGGNLFVSRSSSLITEAGLRQPDFMLADVMGVHYQGETREKFTYSAPQPGFEGIMPEFSQKYPLGLEESQVLVSAEKNARVMAKITLPYTDPADFTRFSSIHSNPPGIPTDYPSLVMNSYGKGKVIYSAASLEGVEYARSIFINLLNLFKQPYSFEADAPASVEVTLFQQPDQKRFIINLLNFQKDLPNIPVDGIKVRVRLPGLMPGMLSLLPEGAEMSYSIQATRSSSNARLETFRMFSLEYNPKTSR